MARIAEEESDSDDLPELKDLLKSFKARPGSEATTKTSSSSVTGQQPKSRKAEDAGGKEKEVRREVKKKRVLKKTCDNPLLRPLNAQARGSETGGGGKGNRIEAKRDVSGSKSRNVTPLEGLFSDEEKVLRRSKVECLKDGSGKRIISKGSERDVTPLEESISSREQDKFGVKGRTRKVFELKPAEKREPGPQSDYDSDGLSDFIVDSTFLEEEDSITEMPPRSTRKLVQGRKTKREEEFDDDDLDLELSKLKIRDGGPKRGGREKSEEEELKAFAAEFSDEEVVPKKSAPRKLFDNVKMKPPQRTKEASPKKKIEPPSSDIEDPFTLRYSPSESKPRKVSQETRFTTPPRSPEPKPRGLQSPTKKFQRIPATPHRQSMDAFWQADVINEWNDEYSPRKTPKPRAKLQEKDDASESNDLALRQKKSPVKQDRAIKEAKKAFSLRKHEIAEAFLTELDDKITDGKISKLSASTGGVKIIWSKKLNTTAGRANWKRETIKSLSSFSAPPTHRHHAAIELAEKVIDDEDRLLNVIAHEFCHLANFMISNIKTNPHGKEFKAWASKVSSRFADRGIEVTTKHSYVIDYKYIWECEACGLEFKRHSKSIDPKRHSCGSCKSRLVQVKPVPRANGEGKGGDWEKKVNEYQVFVKENMRKVKEENPGSPQKEIMVLVGKKYQEYKAGRLGEGSKKVETISIDGIDEKDEEIEVVARKLDFLDLTSP